MAETMRVHTLGGEDLLFLTDEQIRRGIEAMFFAYRAFTADPDLILAGMDYGRAHHRALHFIHRDPGLTVTSLPISYPKLAANAHYASPGLRRHLARPEAV